MTVEEFRSTLRDEDPPGGISTALQAMWEDGRGRWEAAHAIAQDIDDKAGAWIHAYLHRKEGDLGNAGYWYGRAGQPVAYDAIEEEWARIVRALL